MVGDGGAEWIALQLSLRMLEESGTVLLLSDSFSSGLTRDGWSVTVTVIAAAGSGVAGWFCVETGMVPTLVALRSITVIGRGGVGKTIPNVWWMVFRTEEVANGDK